MVTWISVWPTPVGTTEQPMRFSDSSSSWAAGVRWYENVLMTTSPGRKPPANRPVSAWKPDTSGPIGSKMGPGDTKILRIFASGTVQKPPNGGSAFWRSGIALFLMTGSRARSSVERTFFGDRPACSSRRRTPGAFAHACSSSAASQAAWYRSRAPADMVSRSRFQ